MMSLLEKFEVKRVLVSGLEVVWILSGSLMLMKVGVLGAGPGMCCWGQGSCGPGTIRYTGNHLGQREAHALHITNMCQIREIASYSRHCLLNCFSIGRRRAVR